MISITYALVPRSSDNGWLVERTISWLWFSRRSYLSRMGGWETCTYQIHTYGLFTKNEAMDRYYLVCGQFWLLS